MKIKFLLNLCLFFVSLSLFAETILLPDGGVFTGTVNKEGLLSGYGEIKWGNGNFYEGEFSSGVYSGKGTLSGINYIYTGYFKNGVFSGEGKLAYSSGALYQGSFENNMLNGQGNYTDDIGNIFVGTFTNGLLNGQGSLHFANGNVYVGNFKDNIIMGKGIYTFINGDRYIGNFKDGLFDGDGKYIYSNGKIIEGVFSYGYFPDKIIKRKSFLQNTNIILLCISVFFNVLLSWKLYRNNQAMHKINNKQH